MVQFYNVFEYPIVRDQLVANTVLAALATIAVILRFVSRRLRRNELWWDDYCCIGSILHTYGMLAMHYHYARVGMRHHVTDIPWGNTVVILKMLIIYQAVYYNAMVLAKLSYLFFYLRIFVTKAFRIAAWVCMGCACAYWVGSVLQIFLICQPFEKNWNPFMPGHCASQNVAFSTIGAFNLVTDVMIMILPLHFIWKLQMSLATKLALYGIFGLGIFISAITIIRIRVLTTVDFNDLSYSMIWAAFWSVAEPALAIMNACVPMMRPVFKAAFPTLFASAKVGYTTAGAQSGASGSNNNAFKRIHDEYPLTQIEEGDKPLSHGAGSGYEASLNDRSVNNHSHDGSTRQIPSSVIGNGVKAWS